MLWSIIRLVARNKLLARKRVEQLLALEMMMMHSILGLKRCRPETSRGSLRAVVRRGLAVWHVERDGLHEVVDGLPGGGLGQQSVPQTPCKPKP